MGYSHERGAAVRTVLRARAIGDAKVIEDAETAVSGYLNAEDIDEYAGYHAPDGLPENDPVVTLVRERDELRARVAQLEAERDAEGV